MKQECGDTWRRGNLGKGTDCSEKMGFFRFAVWGQRNQYPVLMLPVLFDDLVYADDSLLLQEAFGAVTYSFPLLPGSPLTMAILISFLEIDLVSPWKEIGFYQKPLSFTQTLLYPCSLSLAQQVLLCPMNWARRVQLFPRCKTKPHTATTLQNK